jgi:lysophospholipase L1-like esterase
MLSTTRIVLLVLVALSYSGDAQVTNQRLFDTIPFLPEHYAKKVAQFEKEAVVTGKIIFLGNSITEGGAWPELTGDKTVINRGIGGDITFGVLSRLPDIIKRKPAKLFILIGINDIGKDIPDAVIADNCKKIIALIKADSPQTKIYLQSILPLNPFYPGFPQHYDKENHVTKTNELLRQTAVSSQVTFVNLHPLFLDAENHLDKKYTGDGLHLNRQGYERWVSYLKESKFL